MEKYHGVLHGPPVDTTLTVDDSVAGTSSSGELGGIVLSPQRDERNGRKRPYVKSASAPAAEEPPVKHFTQQLNC
jgi:hypothetical protein